MATPASGNGGGAGLLMSYNTTTTPAASANLASVTVVSPSTGAWYDVEAYCWNSGTTGVAGTDDCNIGLYSDPVTAGTMVLQRIVPWNCFLIAAGNTALPFRTSVYAKSTIELLAMAAGTSGAKYVCHLTVNVASLQTGV
jgi:hypothetical protein